MEAIDEAVMTNPQIIYYGPHPCDLCGGETIVRGSMEQGFGNIRLSWPEGEIVYPNHQWKEHVCSKPCAFCGKQDDQCECPHPM